ncbi:MAG: NYN domain-containing protein [Candidatus Brocadiales bacterium]
MLIIIDAYNLIFTISDLDTGTKQVDIGAVRDNLISLLDRYKSIKGYEMKVVFDGTPYNSNHSLTNKRVISGIEVIFSGASSDADTVIKKLASQWRDPGNICVVTSDREIRDFVKRCGNTVVDTKGFYREVLSTVNKEKESYSEPRCKFEGISSQEEIDYWLGVFGDKQGEDKKDD